MPRYLRPLRLRSSITGIASVVAAAFMIALSGDGDIGAHAEFVPVSDTVVLIDGDTVSIRGERVRILSIDTPETWKPRCERELVLGLKAKARLRELLDNGSPVSIERHGLDRYRRTLAHVRVGNIDIGKTLLSEGFALPYVAGWAAKQARLAHWCPSGTARVTKSRVPTP